jgi:N-acylneuraminate cytidylyltransferase
MKTLFVIPARGGSKGIPGKNIKYLGGAPLIKYSIDIARKFTTDNNICVTTDDPSIAETVEGFGLALPFMRPPNLATDTASTNDVLLHAIAHYESLGSFFEVIILLQPTSPFRKAFHITESLNEYKEKNADMVMSVFEARANPYYVLFEENDGILKKIKQWDGNSRQQAPKVYQANGSIYIINVESFKKCKDLKRLTNIRKYVMEEIWSLDIDLPIDLEIAEILMQKGYFK